MATATIEAMPEDPARHLARPSSPDLGAIGDRIRSLSLSSTASNPELERYTSRTAEDLLESIVLHIEQQLRSADAVLSPTEIPQGIQTLHSRQIEVCLARFKASKIPAVSVREYLQRLHRHCPFSTSKLLAMFHYLTVLDMMYLRIAKVLKDSTVHRLVLTAAVIASKILDDRLIPQVRWSVVGGINLHQLHGLELAFFFLLNGKCWISEKSLINAGQFLQGQLDLTETINPMLHTVDSEVIWSSVGNRPQDGSSEAPGQ